MSSPKLKFDNTTWHKAQDDFHKCDAQISAFVGGLGSGKTYIFLRKVLHCFVNKVNPKTNKSNGIVVYPTYRLAEELFVGPFQEMLDALGIDYKYNISDHLFTSSYGRLQIFHLKRPQDIVGTAYTYAGFDEFDIESYKNCHTAFVKIIGRMRGSEDWQIFFVTSPEGKHYTYKIFVADNEDGTRKLFRAKTTDNVHNPESYVKAMEENYDSRLLKAYRDGEFVNLTQVQIYYAFNQDCVKPVTYSTSLPCVLMWDFNVGEKPMTCIIGQEQGDKIAIRASLSQRNSNTYRMLEYCEAELRKLHGGGLPTVIDLYGDYAGRSRSSNSDLEDWTIIKKFWAQKNVRTRDYVQRCRSVSASVKSVNHNLEAGNILIHSGEETKPLRDDLELVVWDKDGQREDQSDNMRSHQSAALRYYIDVAKPIIQRIVRH